MEPWAKNIEELTKSNETYRTVVWTGKHIQVTVMCIKPGDDVGLEAHPNVDQFLRIESGKAHVTFGPSKDEVTKEYDAEDDWAVIVPAGVWHNLINTGESDLKLYSIYGPPNHPADRVQQTHAEAEADEAAEHGEE